MVWVSLWNVAAFAALDVTMRVTADGGAIVAESAAERIRGCVPGTVGGKPDLATEARIPDEYLLGNRMPLTFTARFSDEHGIQRWEQRGHLTWESRNGRFECVEFDSGEPVIYSV
jgi:hypothetical protein